MTPLNLRSFGAVLDGKTDDSAALVMALSVAKAQAQPLLIPAGICAYSRTLTAEGVVIVGEGNESVLHSLNPLQAAIILRGVGAELHGLRLSGIKPTVRTSAAETCRVAAIGASRFVVRDVTIDSGSAAAIHVRGGSSGGRITGNRIGGTLADSIHITDRSTGITIEGNEIAGSGDDGIAVVSYRAQGTMVTGVTARRNRIRDNRGGRCMSVVGGADVLYEDNELSGNAGAAGLIVAQEEGKYLTFGARNVTARHNTILNCGNAAIGHYAVLVTSAGGDTNEGITLERNLIVQDDARGGIAVRTVHNRGVVLDSSVVLASPQMQIQTPDVSVQPYAGGPVGVRWAA